MADAEDVTVIGQGSKVTGRITGEGSLEILGHVEGEVEVTGEVTVGDEGLVGSNVAARRIVVRGAVRGDLSASESIALAAGARVVGDLRAPRITVTAGALIRGNVQTAEAGSGSARSQSAARRIATEPRAAVPAAAPSRARAEPVRAVPPAPRSVREVARPAATAGAAPRAGVASPPKKSAPAPVVPVLKKGAKGAMKKRAGG